VGSHVAVVLQYVALCYTVLQCVAVHFTGGLWRCTLRVLQCVAVYCSVLQCVAACFMGGLSLASTSLA